MACIEVCLVHDDVLISWDKKPGKCCGHGECEMRFFSGVELVGRQWLFKISGAYEELPRILNRAMRFDVLLPLRGKMNMLEETRVAADVLAASSIAQLRVRLPAIVIQCIREHLCAMLLASTWLPE